MRLGALLLLPLLATGATAQIANLAVTSGASFEPGVPARGSLASVFCTGLEVPQLVAAAGYPLPRSLAGVEVRIGGAPAALYAVAPLAGYQQINVQVPQEASFGGPEVEVEVSQDGRRASVRAPVRATSPGDFFRLPGNWAVLQHGSDYSLVTPQNPARAGEILLAYLTGMSGTQPPVASGEPAPFEPLAVVPQYANTAAAEIDQILLDTAAITPLFVGLTPGLAGVYQVNFAVPLFLRSGDLALTLQHASCLAFFGSCANGGGVRTFRRNTPALVPVR